MRPFYSDFKPENYIDSHTSIVYRDTFFKIRGYVTNYLILGVYSLSEHPALQKATVMRITGTLILFVRPIHVVI